MKKLITALVGLVIVVQSLTPPWDLSISCDANPLVFLWVVLACGFLSFYFFYTSANIWIKLLLIWSFINCFFSHAPYLSFIIFTNVIACTYFYLLCKKLQEVDKIIKIIQAIFFLMVMLLVLQSFGKDPLMNFNTKTIGVWGTIGNAMIFSSFISCLAALLLLSSPLNLIPTLLMVIIASSLGGVLSISCGMLFYLYHKIKNKVVYILILVLALGCLTSYAHYKKVNVKIFGGRWPVWKRTAQLTLKYPIIGWGIGTYKVIFPVLSKDVAGGRTEGWKFEWTQGNWVPWRQTHNCWLQFPFEIGWAGTIILWAYIIVIFYRLSKFIKSETILRLFTGGIIIAVNMLFHFPTRIPQAVPLMIFFIALCEIVIARGGTYVEHDQQTNDSKLSPK